MYVEGEIPVTTNNGNGTSVVYPYPPYGNNGGFGNGMDGLWGLIALAIVFGGFNGGNGFAVPGSFANETITTPNTELRTLTLDYYTLVDNTCVLGCNSTIAKAISIVNTGVPATFTSIVINIEKVV